jgi:hypothetical protein
MFWFWDAFRVFVNAWCDGFWGPIEPKEVEEPEGQGPMPDQRRDDPPIPTLPPWVRSAIRPKDAEVN